MQDALLPEAAKPETWCPVLWTGPKHHGKTTAATELVRRARSEGHAVAGLLAPSLWEGGRLAGFDGIDVATGERRPLARCAAVGEERVGAFTFSEGGLAFGRAALAPEATGKADLVVVDEFGPLELRGAGWRPEVDRLAASAAGLVLLVVRSSLAEAVAGLYRVPATRRIDSTEVDQAVAAVLGLMVGR